MPAVRDPVSILDAARRAALGYANRTSAGAVAALMRKSHVELQERLKSIPASDSSFTTVQMRTTLKQIEAVLRMTKTGLLGTVVKAADEVGQNSTAATMRYLREAETAYGGVAGSGLGINTAKVFDKAVSGANTSVLRRIATDPSHPGNKGVMDRYGDAVIDHFEQTLQTSLVAGTPWDDVKSNLVKGSTFLQSAPQHWAERIVRTELMGAHNQAGNLAIQEIDEQTGGYMIRILCATFDDRTASDSYAVHGQIRRMTEPFDSWFGAYMTPPNRPNDREVIVPHHIEWKIPKNLEPKSDAEVAARWRLEKRKGSPPPRPLLSTVPEDQIGKPIVAAGPPPVTADNVMDTKLADATGSNAGGVYRGADGVERYVKLYKDPAQAAGEHLSNRLYADLGLPALNSHVLPRENGVPIYASDIIPGVTQLGKVPGGITPELARHALEGFVGDLLTANWDAAGLNIDNMVVTPDKKVMRIDNGGTFLMRAKGGRKPSAVLNELTEWDKLFDASVNPAYAMVAHQAGVSSAADMLPQIREQLARVTALVEKSGGWKSYVSQHAPTLKPDDATAIVQMLESRTAKISKKLVETEASVAKSKKAAELKLKMEAAAKKLEADKAKIAAAKSKKQVEVAVKQSATTTNLDAWVKVLETKSVAKAADVAAVVAEKSAIATEAIPTPKVQPKAKRPVVTQATLSTLESEDVPLRPAYKGEGRATRDWTHRESAAQLKPLLSTDEKMAVTNFTASAYRDIRAAKYKTKAEYDIGYNTMEHRITYEEAKSAADHLDAMVEKVAKIKSDPNRLEKKFGEFYRGLNNLSQSDFEALINKDVIEFNAPTSTSWDPMASKGFYGHRRSIFFRITPAEHTAGVSIEGYSHNTPEAEVLFGTGSKFRVRKVVRDAEKEDGVIMYIDEIADKTLRSKKSKAA